METGPESRGESEPRSVVMVLGTPCKLTILDTYSRASSSTQYEVLTGRKWATLVNVSTMTQIALLPRRVLGNPVMKSIQTSSHFHCDTGSGWRSPAGF